MSINELEAKARELMEVRKEIEELEAMKTAIEDAIKYEMAQQGAETLTAGDYKMTWKVVTGTRFDSTAFKKANPELAKAFANDNPLADSASYTVFLKNIDEQDAFVNSISKVQGVRKVKHSEQAKEALSKFSKLLGYVSIALIVILLGVGIFLISNTVMIGITVRRHEIKIMKLIGSTNGFVRAPFIIEGVIIGLVGSAIPLVILRVIYERLIAFVMSKVGVMASSISFATVGEIFGVLVPLGLGIGAGIGLVGSFLSIRKHLKV